jgi:nicotinamide phosphoribosyltransferase
MVIPGKNIIISMENTDDELPWVTNFFETILMNVWYPITVATLSFNIKQIITDYAKKTSDIGCTPYHLNDFGARSVSSPESAGIGGMAHLVNFAGTDTLNGVRYARHYYDAGKAVAASVFATEHSTTTSWTREHEIDAYEHFLDACPEGICSVVADSYNIYEAVKMFGTTLKEKVLARGSKTGFAKLVIRPDSGEPAEVSVKVLQLLDQYFGSTLNSKGYKILNPKVGMIYGDGINDKSIKEILDAVVAAGFSTDNIVFGMGGELLQGVKRDDLKFAFKCAEAKINNEWVRVYKDPITDPGKVSKKGRLALIKDGDTIRTIEVTDAHKNAVHAIPDLLELVFENGEILREYTFADVRALTETFIK